jgi:hypothetical protein
MENIKEILQHLFTARDGEAYSLTKLIVIAASSTMIYKFATGDTVNFTDFGTGISLIGAIQVGKYFVEDK